MHRYVFLGLFKRPQGVAYSGDATMEVLVEPTWTCRVLWPLGVSVSNIMLIPINHQLLQSLSQGHIREAVKANVAEWCRGRLRCFT
jgi:hypothetical protein